jgi:hypothetical protein
MYWTVRERNEFLISDPDGSTNTANEYPCGDIPTPEDCFRCRIPGVVCENKIEIQKLEGAK